MSSAEIHNSIAKTLAIALCLCMALCADSYWKCKDGTGSSIVCDSGSSRRNGVIDDSGKCVWAREDDRGFFLTFRNGGSVIIPGTDSLEFPKGFDAEFFFSCDFDAIGPTAFSCLFCSGAYYEDGISIMVDKEGAVLVNLNGLSRHFYGLVPSAKIQSKKDTRLRVRYNIESVTLWVNGIYLTSYPTEGHIAYKKGLMRLGSCENYPFTGNLYYVSLRGLDEENTSMKEQPPVSKLEKLQNYKAPNYIDPEGTVIISDFNAFSPKELIVPGSVNIIDKYVFRSNASFWGNGISTMLFTPSDSTVPDISIDPKLSGCYDVYLSVRSTSVSSIVQAAIGKNYYRILTSGLGPKHRSYEMLLARNVAMDRQTLSVAPGNNAYVGYFKLIPSEKGRVNEQFDPAGRVEQGPRMTRTDFEAYSLRSHEELFLNGVIRERFYVETRECAPASKLSQKRGYQLYNWNWMDLLFPNSVPTSDNGSIAIKVSAASGEYEPVSFAVRGLRDLRHLKLSIGKWNTDNGQNMAIGCRIGVVGILYKRSTAYTGNSEVIKGPAFIEMVDHIHDLKAGESRQFWLTLHVPEGTPAGSYKCNITLASDGHTENIPLELTVHPFTLDRPDIGLSFFGFPSGTDEKGVEEAMQDFARHGMTMLFIDEALHLLTFTGDSAENAAIEWKTSRLPFFMERCCRYGLDYMFILTIPSIYNEAAKYGDKRMQVFERFMVDIEQHRSVNNWPKFYYENFDEALSNPEELQKVMETTEVMAKLSLPMSNDHIWYKTSRPFQKQCDAIAPKTSLFINRFNTRDFWYVDTWKQMQKRCDDEGKLLMAYNSNNAIVFSQPTAARFSFGWFHRTAGAGSAGHIMYSYKEPYGSPYDDLDGNCTDWICNYPKWGGYAGGPSLDWESYREGIDDLRYIVTLEKRIAKATEKGVDATAEKNVLNDIIASFDMQKFHEESIFITPKWEKSWNEEDKCYMSGNYNLPNGWNSCDYDNARTKISNTITALDIKLQNK